MRDCKHESLVVGLNYGPRNVECRDCGMLWIPWTPEVLRSTVESLLRDDPIPVTYLEPKDSIGE